ncbi:MAG: hypothetical protein GKR89_16665 [Candidatus Latescibacteria bacterium]|nr:hypothetical protein [Candidatus Latescibacterota bacterium]
MRYSNGHSPSQWARLGIFCLFLLHGLTEGSWAAENEAVPVYGDEYEARFLDVAYAQTPPLVDGEVDEWDQIRWIRFGPGAAGVSTLQRVHDDGPTEPPGTALTRADLSGAFALQWDKEWLYLAVRVVDNVRDITGGIPIQWYFKDGVHFFLDLPLDGDGPVYVVGDHSFPFVADPTAGPNTKWWRRGVAAENSRQTRAPVQTQLAVRLGQRGDYVLEAAIPMDALVESTPAFNRPIAEQVVGFMFLATDPDGGAGRYGGQLVYGADDDDDTFWPRLRFKAPGSPDRALGRIEGRVRWEDAQEGRRLGRVRIESVDNSLWFGVKADSQGVFTSIVPVGSYRITAGYRRHQSTSIAVEVSAERTAQVPELQFARPPFGRRVQAGKGRPVPFAPLRVVEARGRSVPAGVGTRQGRWHSLQVSDGLAANTVQDMIQDDRGNLWFATEAGLCRYDGLEFTTFTTADGLSSNEVMSVLQDRQGDIWVGTGSDYENRGGIARFDGRHFTTYTDSLPAGAKVIFEARNGHLWFGTRDGLIRYDGQQATLFTTADGLPVHHMNQNSILEDRQGHLWFAMDSRNPSGAKGTVRFDGERFTVFDRDDGLPVGHRPMAILEDRHGDMWFGSGAAGVTRFDGESLRTYTMEDGLAGNTVVDALEDGQGHLWFATRNGVSRYDGRSFTSFREADGLTHNVVRSALEDREGNLWFGTGYFGSGNGVSRYQGRHIYPGLAGESWAGDRVLALLDDRSGRLWVSGLGGDELKPSGLSLLEEGHWTHISGRARAPEGDSTNIDTAIKKQWKDALKDDVPSGAKRMLEDRQGQFWFAYGLWQGIAGRGGGVMRFDGERVHTFAQESGLPDSWVGALLEDSQGRVWVGTGEGICRMVGNTCVPVGPEAERLQGVGALLEDSQGRVWAGTFGGTGYYRGETFKRFTRDDGLAHNIVHVIYEDDQGDLWFGTESGVSRYDGHQFTSYTTADGLSAAQVVSIAQDDRGRLLFGTLGGGLNQYDGLVFQSLQVRDGLMDNRVRQVLVRRDGDILIATDGGLTRYRPSRTPPPVHLTDVVADQRYGPVAALAIPHTQRLLSFEFLGQSYKTARDQLAYAYRLEGDDEEWRWTRERRVEYTGLPEGHYTFQVKAVDRDLTYSDTAATVAVEIFHQATVHPYRIVDVQLDDLFASFYPTYARHPFGAVTLANDSPDTASVQLRLYLPDFMRRPIEREMALVPRSEQRVDLTAHLDPDILTVQETVQTQAEVELSFAQGDQTIAVRESRDITLHGRGALRWDQVGRAAAFVTSADPGVAAFARPLLAAFEEETTAWGQPMQNLIRAMVLFEGLKAHGIRYIADANTPYSQVSSERGSIDHIRYPAETLQHKAGDCDDLTVLYAALLENAGIATALVDYPGHIFLLFDSGVARAQADQLPLAEGDFLVQGDRLWIPVEITLLGDSFQRAWQAGLEELGKLSGSQQRQSVVATAAAWAHFPAASPSFDLPVEGPQRRDLEVVFANQYGLLGDRVEQHIETQYLDPLKIQPDNDALRLQLIQLYLVLRQYDTAIQTAEDHLLDEVGDKAATYNQLAVAIFLKGEVRRAALTFKQAVALDPDNRGLQLNLDLAMQKLGKSEGDAPQLAGKENDESVKGQAEAIGVDDFYWLE